MAGEINFFRKRFLGGFDKQDVVDYIAEQADERNKLSAKIEKVESDYEALVEEARAEQVSLIEKAKSDHEAFIEQSAAEREAFEAEKKALNAEIESLKQRCNEIEKQAQDYKVASLISAGDVLEEVKRSLDGYQGVVEAAVSRARDEFMLAADTVAALPQIFERTGETVSSLIEQINDECSSLKFGEADRNETGSKAEACSAESNLAQPGLAVHEADHV